MVPRPSLQEGMPSSDWIEEEVHKHKEEVMEEEPQLVDCMMHALAGYGNLQTMKVRGLLKQQPITILIDTGSTNKFMNNKVATWMVLHIEGCSRFDVKVADSRILKYDLRCLCVKLILQDQEIVDDFFLPLDDYDVLLGIEWLTMLGDIS
ncbi:hypothetical protein BHE74_00011668 [Ensete ventricosum]|nr:hypothetical protein BHE74_00011668 [Ensete ventricosum]